jgi:hypothetical protein
MKRDVLDDTVALVEDSEDRDALRHRSDSSLAVGGRGDLPSRKRRIGLLAALPARTKSERSQQRCSDTSHAYLGIQGS